MLITLCEKCSKRLADCHLISFQTHVISVVIQAYEEILDISLFFTLILTFSCCSLSMANTGDEVIYLHYFDFVNFYKKV